MEYTSTLYIRTTVRGCLSCFQLFPIISNVRTIVYMDANAYKHTFLKMSSTLLVVPVYFLTSWVLEFPMLIIHVNTFHCQTFHFCQWWIWSSVSLRCLFISSQPFGFPFFFFFWSDCLEPWCIFPLGCMCFSYRFVSSFYMLDAGPLFS